MKRLYLISWDDDLGPEWMNLDNLKACLFSKTCIGGDAVDKVTVEETTSAQHSGG